MQNLFYEDAVRTLAWMMQSVSEAGSSPPTLCHFCENDLHAVPDMLSRLGIMRGDGHVSHEFIEDWRSPEELHIIRHIGEPSIGDLGLGLDFCAVWYRPTNMREDNPVRQAVIKVAADLGRGIIIDGEYLPEDTRGEDILESYWTSRANAIHRLGSEPLLYPEVSRR